MKGNHKVLDSNKSLLIEIIKMTAESFEICTEFCFTFLKFDDLNLKTQNVSI